MRKFILLGDRIINITKITLVTPPEFDNTSIIASSRFKIFFDDNSNITLPKEFYLEIKTHLLDDLPRYEDVSNVSQRTSQPIWYSHSI